MYFSFSVSAVVDYPCFWSGQTAGGGDRRLMKVFFAGKDGRETVRCGRGERQGEEERERGRSQAAQHTYCPSVSSAADWGLTIHRKTNKLLSVARRALQCPVASNPCGRPAPATSQIPPDSSPYHCSYESSSRSRWKGLPRNDFTQTARRDSWRRPVFV